MSSNLHLISFDVPHPPDYGGVVDVFYRIKALSELGIKVHLHCFEYGRGQSGELERYCQSVHYYRRHTNLSSVWYPHIVASRSNEQLLKNLLADDFPILFEGIHTCAFLDHEHLTDRLKLVRLHNIEAHYYRYLAQNEPNLLRRAYFSSEAWKLARFEGKLAAAQHLLAISPNDFAYFSPIFGKRVHYIPAFHAHNEVVSPTGRGQFALYHGNLSVNENYQAALFLANEVFNDLQIPFIIAGKNPHIGWFQSIQKYSHIELCVNPSELELFELMQDAHLHVLPTFQPTGIKLKLLHALYTGRFCLANQLMVQNTGLETLCSIANTPAQFKAKVQQLFELDFTNDLLNTRKALLEATFSNLQNARKIVALLEG